MASKKYWDMLDTKHPEYVKEVVALINWSHNCDYATPFDVFLDMTGWSETEIGVNICKTIPNNIGYVELSYLADALKEYVKRPNDVHQWISELMREEGK